MSQKNNCADAPIAIIGGNTLGALPNLSVKRRRIERTPYGELSTPLLYGSINNKPVVFLARHGDSKTISTEPVNDLANIYALQQTNAKVIIGISSAIGLVEHINAGDFIVPDQLIDLTNLSIARFPNSESHPHRPLHFAEPFDQYWRQALIGAGLSINQMHSGGVYILTSGQRSETKAEAKYYKSMGGIALGATGAQESALARDLDIPFVQILVVIRPSVDLVNSIDISLNFNNIAQTISNWIGNL